MDRPYQFAKIASNRQDAVLRRSAAGTTLQQCAQCPRITRACSGHVSLGFRMRAMGATLGERKRLGSERGLAADRIAAVYVVGGLAELRIMSHS